MNTPTHKRINDALWSKPSAQQHLDWLGRWRDIYVNRQHLTDRIDAEIAKFTVALMEWDDGIH